MASNYIDLIIDRENNNYDIHDKRIPTLPNDETKYLNGKGQWTVPDGSGGGGPTPSGDPTEYYNGAGQWSKPITLSGNVNEYYNGRGEWTTPPDNNTLNTAGSTLQYNANNEEFYFIGVSSKEGTASQQTYIPTRGSSGDRIHPVLYLNSGVTYVGGLKIKTQDSDWAGEDGPVFHRIYVQTSTPTSVNVGDVWIDLNEE